MKRFQLMSFLALCMLLFSCKKDPNPYCWKCTLRDFRVKPETEKYYYLCDKNEDQIRQYEQDSTTKYREQEMFCSQRENKY